MKVFLDVLGRTITGEEVADKSTDEKLAIKNPVVLDIVPNQETQQLQLRMIPLIFKEFQAAKDEDVVFYFNKANVTMCEDFELEFRIKAQYQQLFSNIIIPEVTPPSRNTEVVNLFDK
jgi:hypothetical protein